MGASATGKLSVQGGVLAAMDRVLRLPVQIGVAAVTNSGATALEASDSDLLHASLRNNQAAGRELVNRYWQRLYHFCRRLGATPETAEDLVQETFARLWNNPGSWRPERGHMSTWLYRVATNLYRDQLRRLQRRRLVIDEEAADREPSAYQCPEGDERQRQIQHAIGRLPVSQRTALVLCYFEGLSNRQAARVVGVSIAALESILARARRALSTELSGT